MKTGTTGALTNVLCILHRTTLSNSEQNPLLKVQVDYLEILGCEAGRIAVSITTGVDLRIQSPIPRISMIFLFPILSRLGLGCTLLAI